MELERLVLRAVDGGMVWPLAIAIAIAVGALHGLAPGHGKTLAAAYLIGTGARWRHAAVLAGLVAAMHTLSVLVLGVLWWVVVGTGSVPLDAITRWGQLVIGIAVLVVGVVIVRRRWRSRGSHHHHHHHDDHHTQPMDKPWSRAGLAGVASAGGLLPSPSAFLVLITGLLLGRAELAVAMVVAFGLGLAASVLVIGMAAVTGLEFLRVRARSHGRLARMVARAPDVGAAGVVLAGCILCTTSVAGLVAG